MRYLEDTLNLFVHLKELLYDLQHILNDDYCAHLISHQSTPLLLHKVFCFVALLLLLHIQASHESREVGSANMCSRKRLRVCEYGQQQASRAAYNLVIIIVII